MRTSRNPVYPARKLEASASSLQPQQSPISPGNVSVPAANVADSLPVPTEPRELYMITESDEDDPAKEADADAPLSSHDFTKGVPTKIQSIILKLVSH